MGILLLIGLLFLFLMVGIYNKYIKLKNLNEEAWSTYESYLQKRWDLIPNLVEIVKGYSKHESETLTEVVKARTQMVNIDTKNANDMEQAMKIENKLSSTLKSIFALSERYPDLKANENYLKLQTQLGDIENEIQMSRRYYNGTVREQNTFIEKFPNNIIAGILNFKKAIFFDANDEAHEAPKVEF